MKKLNTTKILISLALVIGLLLPIAHSPVNHIPIFTPTIAYSDTGYVDPDGDGTPLQWTPFSVTSHYLMIDDGVRQPDTPSDVSDYITQASADVTDVYSMTTLTASSVTSIKVWVYGYFFAGSKLTTPVSIYMGGSWTTPTDEVITSSSSWHSVTFDGTWTQTDLNGLQVNLTHHQTGWPPPAQQNIYALYCEVTYTAGGGGGATTKPYFIKKKKGIFFIK